jgi:hypothetical protein
LKAGHFTIKDCLLMIVEKMVNFYKKLRFFGLDLTVRYGSAIRCACTTGLQVAALSQIYEPNDFGPGGGAHASRGSHVAVVIVAMVVTAWAV